MSNYKKPTNYECPNCKIANMVDTCDGFYNCEECGENIGDPTINKAIDYNFDFFQEILKKCKTYKNFYLLALNGDLNKLYTAEKNFQSANMTHATVTLYNSKTNAVIFDKSIYINAKKEPVLKIDGKNLELSEFK